MNKKRKSLNKQQLTAVVNNHEVRITKLETKKKKIIKKCGKGPKVTIANVMQTLVKFQISVLSFKILLMSCLTNLKLLLTSDLIKFKNG